MKTVLKDGEKIVKKSSANHQRGIEAVGGMLYLTTARLIFVTCAQHSNRRNYCLNS